MGIKSTILKPIAHYITNKVDRKSNRALEIQEKIRKQLVHSAQQTAFGSDHQFSSIRNYEDFKSRVPIRDYEGLSGYIERIKRGEPNILWSGKPIYFAKTSGTTSGSKFIPITKDSINHHLHAARNALFAYVAETGNAQFFDGKMIFLQGSPELEEMNGIKVGRLSGIVYNHVPGYLLRNRMPTFKTNCIEDWETKVDAIVEETLRENMTLISGIPPWVMMYFERLLDKSGKQKIKDIFPNFSLFVHGGVNYEPYRANMEDLIGFQIPQIETYPASEGFIAYQNSQVEEGLLLNIDAGIFYEFIPADEYFDDHPTRISLKDVELGVNYALILNTNAGLWGYSIGDTVKFVSKHPYKIIVSGRIKHFISAFGEHVIGEEVESSLRTIALEEGIKVIEFTVAPQMESAAGLPFHEWFIEFENEPANLQRFEQKIDKQLCDRNTYYNELVEGGMLQTLKIRSLQKDAFRNYMKSKGRLGGQNKVARLSNDRTIVDELQVFVKK